MAAHNADFPWLSYYGNYNFFEKRLEEHTAVREYNRLSPGLYEVELSSSQTIRVFICECYSFGVAEYHEAVENLGHIDAVVINSSWCGYGAEAKRYGRDHRVGFFNIADFMAGINRPDFWMYLNPREREQFAQQGWI